MVKSLGPKIEKPKKREMLVSQGKKSKNDSLLIGYRPSGAGSGPLD
jgi:hypothetical protein